MLVKPSSRSGPQLWKQFPKRLYAEQVQHHGLQAVDTRRHPAKIPQTIARLDIP
ncbi:hypothetical protein HSBGL_4005 (plasmid) [Halapricum desulfuricans]|uniref:Uncharacterized protein n=1 Tax=Halapricum desulfuricans TaxID=2841257 RepID=A0A897NRF1_9EURY|nr:hypothetical protein HSBGL_4005 [Halapricum desulfuricans]